MKPIQVIGFLVWLMLTLSGSGGAEAETISLPVSLDPHLLRAFIVRQAFPGTGAAAVLTDPQNRCNRIELKDPRVDTSQEGMTLTARIRLEGGLPVKEDCLRPLDWAGNIRVRMKPFLESGDWRLRFQVVDSRLFRETEDEISLARVFWDLVKRFVHPHLEQCSIDLVPPLDQIRALVPLLIQPKYRDRLESGLRTLRPGEVDSGPEAIRIPVLFELELPKQAADVSQDSGLPDYDPQRLQALWELWDPFVVFQILTLAGRTLTAGEQDRIWEILLAGRYRISRELDGTGIPDFGLLRREMSAAWVGLGPLLRKYLVQDPSPNLVNYLAFFSVMDALQVLEKIGPAFGLDISRDGLVRLAGLLAPSPPGWEPRYSEEVDPRLREILMLGPPLKASEPNFDAEEMDLPVGERPEPAPGQGNLFRRRIRPAAAGGGPPSEVTSLLPWVPPSQGIEPYVERVRGVIFNAVSQVLRGQSVEEKHRENFKKLVSATAWQESCWRQFTVSGGKIRYLTSYNRTSVGLMQINVRVWRGMYRPQSLRWNIRYNARAGTEILARYLRYAVGKTERSGTSWSELIYHAVYAMYNGGPDQFALFLERARKDRRYLSDRLFGEKYRWVEEGRWEKIGLCLNGQEI